MTNEKFEIILEERIKKIRFILGSKAKEYAGDGDRLYSFKRAADTNRNTPAQSLWGMLSKHLVSIINLVEGTQNVTEDPDSYRDRINEKIGDMINYLILLEAILKEEISVEEVSAPE